MSTRLEAAERLIKHFMEERRAVQDARNCQPEVVELLAELRMIISDIEIIRLAFDNYDAGRRWHGAAQAHKELFKL
jgi:hypothetical protein